MPTSHTEDLFCHNDELGPLGEAIPLAEKLAVIHRSLDRQVGCISRIAVAAYDQATESVRTFLSSDRGAPSPIQHYEIPLSQAPSLAEVAQLRRPRVVNDLALFQASTHQHTQRILAQGYQSSYTSPILFQGDLHGFVFFNAEQQTAFNDRVLPTLDLASHLIANLAQQEIGFFHTLSAALKTLYEISTLRDLETSGHLERMGRYARLIARDLAERGIHDFSDEHIERIYRFAPFHDIGKIGIPDHILFKPGKLDPEEWSHMQQHTTIGGQILGKMVDYFGFSALDGLDVLRSVAELHHEALDGSGYPFGLAGEEIPIEVRIITVSDIFDALTSQRPYKTAWDIDTAFTVLDAMAKDKLDHECVGSLRRQTEQIVLIQQHFVDRS
ncbi:MAG: hypothetical protein AUJ55_02265 [Proteobacteria bacterium CG1_02_64_396]|nr:MAG: hypothetical protein AUJ55_02265 [Proteobacteria bacterium CG1_02_64_396]